MVQQRDAGTLVISRPAASNYTGSPVNPGRSALVLDAGHPRPTRELDVEDRGGSSKSCADAHWCSYLHSVYSRLSELPNQRTDYGAHQWLEAGYRAYQTAPGYFRSAQGFSGWRRSPACDHSAPPGSYSPGCDSWLSISS